VYRIQAVYTPTHPTYLTDAQMANQTLPSMRSEGSLPCSQKPTTGPYPELPEPNSYLANLISLLILSSHLCTNHQIFIVPLCQKNSFFYKLFTTTNYHHHNHHHHHHHHHHGLNSLTRSCFICTRVYPKFSGLAAWRSEDCKW
jgi:hypothetical protein